MRRRENGQSGGGRTFHTSRETFQNSLVHVVRGDPVAELPGHTLARCRDSVALQVRADKRAFFDARDVRGIRLRQPTNRTVERYNT